MNVKLPLLMLLDQPADWALDWIAEQYEIRNEAGPDVKALLVSGRDVVDEAMIDALPGVEIIAVCAVGYDKIDVAYALSKGIAVTNTPEVLTDDVADLTLALMLAVARRLTVNDRYVRDGVWGTEGAPPLARKFGGQRIGIVGLGRIGQAVARRACAFDCEIAYFARSAKEQQPWRYEPDLRELASWADMLVITVAGGRETAGLIDSQIIRALGRTGVLINVARGSVVDEAALVGALVEGKLGGAGLDVFADEPNVPHVLRTLDNVVLQPHQGSATRETRAAMGKLAADNLAAHFADRPLPTPVPRPGSSTTP